jgi:hypothetical protein
LWQEEARGHALGGSKTKYVSPYDIAVTYAGLEDKEKVFEWLNISRSISRLGIEGRSSERGLSLAYLLGFAADRNRPLIPIGIIPLTYPAF